MSWVANVMLSVEGDDQANAEEFSRWLDEECPRRELGMARGGCGNLAVITGSDTQWGGYKYPECHVYAGALNHADLDAVVDRFGSVPWRKPNGVQLFLMDQEQSFFRVWMIRDGRVQQYAPISPDEEDDEFWPADEASSSLSARSPNR
ncbi:squamosa promoter-binding protein 15 [Planosporangium thailandense]|uniref:Squamosa promoter-binding protein 15 n=1 Tax=Planosporangium thailandense TaxID=765197 RepID=A0ABX0XV12_9ACTN|nr:squamosa promoter-binding protein 15 [Planosporangium thailandense]NJC69869.1 squamosa promoter-binding protein 15 [Planosporangium thailandense]